MATATGKEQCIKCGKKRATSKCAGCLRDFCYSHLTDHRQDLNKELDEIEINRDVFRQLINEQTIDPKNHPLIKEIDQWEQDSIRKIQKTAEECRQLLLQHATERIHQIEINLTKLTDQLRQTRDENDFNEIDLRELKQKLKLFSEELDKPPIVSIRAISAPLVKKISVFVSARQSFAPIRINIGAKWIQNGITVAGGNGDGNQLNQLSSPHGIYVDDDDKCIYIADYGNHRIVEWKYDASVGEVVHGDEKGQENRINQLGKPTNLIVDKKNNSIIISDYQNKRVVRWSFQNDANKETIISDIHCFGLAIDDKGDLYVSDRKKNEVRRWKKEDTIGIIVAGGNGKGSQLNQLSFPSYICVDQDHSVYVADNGNHRVVKWMKGAQEGIVVAGGQGKGDSLIQFDYLQGIIVDHSGNVYVADSGNHRVMRWLKGSKVGSIIVGGNGRGEQPNQFDLLGGLSFDRYGNLFVVDYHNHRIQKFHIDSN